MSDPQVVHVRLEVRVLDPDLLLKYARDLAASWGLDPDHEFTVPEAVYESLVNNAPAGGPLAVGCEIVSSSSE